MVPMEYLLSPALPHTKAAGRCTRNKLQSLAASSAHFGTFWYARYCFLQAPDEPPIWYRRRALVSPEDSFLGHFVEKIGALEEIIDAVARSSVKLPTENLTMHFGNDYQGETAWLRPIPALVRLAV